LNQTFVDFEFIIINDASNDNSENIIESYQDSRIKYFKNEKNLGIAKTLNKGLKLTQGKYIARMDSDDISLSERLDKQFKFMEKNQEIGVCGSYIEKFNVNMKRIAKNPIKHSDIKIELLFQNPLAHPTVIIRKKILDEYSFRYNSHFDGAEDYDLWERMSASIKFANIPEILLRYRTHKNQLSRIAPKKQAKIDKILKRQFVRLEIKKNDFKNILQANKKHKIYNNFSLIKKIYSLYFIGYKKNIKNFIKNKLFIKKMFTSTKKLIKIISTRIYKKSRKKNWQSAQKYELKHAINLMKSDYFKNLHKDFMSGHLYVSKGYSDNLMLKEFFMNDKNKWLEFVEYIKNKNCLDIGPCVFSPISTWDITKKKYGIEPLYKEINQWQKQNLVNSSYEKMRVFNEPAEKLIKEIVNQIDGAILCRNMLDHSDKWPFILINIANYAKPGCKLLLWTDLHHFGKEDDGHFNITLNVDSFKLFIKTIGFKIIREVNEPNREELNWGCFAKKI
jgi:glycosyltransferase involved in cell wall biosynthesis